MGFCSGIASGAGGEIFFVQDRENPGNVDAAVQEYVGIGRVVETAVGGGKGFIGQLRDMFRVAAGNKAVAGVREQKPGYFPLQKGVRCGEGSLHLAEHHALDGKRAAFVQLVMPALLAENLRLGMEQRVQYRIHIDPQEIHEILAVPAGYRVDCPVWEGHGVEEGVQGAFHQFHKRFLYRIALRAAQD